ncbi:MAG: type ISP restriction/modification enzyme [Candidatus Acidiferrales bacterium]
MPFKSYVAELKAIRNSGQATENSYYTALGSLIENLDPSVAVVINPKKTPHGSPDFRLTRKKNVLDFPVGWIEAKEPGEDLSKIARSDQLKRYYNLPNLILTDFLEFRWYTDGKERFKASLGTIVNGKLKFAVDGEAQVEELLRGFLQHKTPPAKDSRELARRMAQLAHFIRDAILIAHEREDATGILHQQMDAFREALIPDLDSVDFADMYAQTIAYGLFAARCQPVTTGEKFTREHAAYLIPKTNPFLRKLFSVIAGPDLPEQILPYVDDLVALLRDTDIGAIMADFGKRTAKEDPVVHFYEDFLQAYDPKLRELRGVYYTPEPVVSYIVRSIDHILKTEFAKPMGLADKDVLILDPACGTGTFLYYVIRHIYDTLCAHGQKGQWNSYVSENLLKRIFGFELLMAPYAVAHLKLGLQLQELGYKFESDERLGVYLTNTLEEAAKKSEIIFAQWIADEANTASEIKRDKPIMVVLGNPPYSVISANQGSWIAELLEAYKTTVRTEEVQIQSLSDDYVKFFRFAHWRIERTGHGIIGMISNNGYLDGPLFRDMRKAFLASFHASWFLNLHGDSRKLAEAAGGTVDQNVFDIQQGVAISLLVRTNAEFSPAKVSYSDLYGRREEKYSFLQEHSLQNTDWTSLSPQSRYYRFVPSAGTSVEDWDRALPISEVFKSGSRKGRLLPFYGAGFTTRHDAFAVGFTEKELLSHISEFLNPSANEAELRERFSLCTSAHWSFKKSRNELTIATAKEHLVRFLYRPFDWRFTSYTPLVLGEMRRGVMQHLLKQNVALVTTRRVTGRPFDNFLVSRQPVEYKACSHDRNTQVFPLYLYGQAGEADGKQSSLLHEIDEPSRRRRANLNPVFLRQVEKQLNLRFTADGNGDLTQTFGPDDLLHYMYALFYCPGYRARYADLLQIDFPRVPLTTNNKLFASLIKKGTELVSLHLMESPKLANFITKYEQPGDHTVEKVRYAEPNPKAGIKSGRVYINDAQYFDGVPKEVWEFQIGGYQVCEKWLKDRKGRKLTSDDIDHYQKIVVALAETIRLMREIDEIIPGWPLP